MMVKASEAAVRMELDRARLKFPSNRQLLHAFVEECGEVTKAFLDMQQGKCTSIDVRKEIIQATAMGFRLLEEGDPEFEQFTPMAGMGATYG